MLSPIFLTGVKFFNHKYSETNSEVRSRHEDTCAEPCARRPPRKSQSLTAGKRLGRAVVDIVVTRFYWSRAGSTGMPRQDWRYRLDKVRMESWRVCC